MATIDVVNLNGEKVGSLELADEVFGAVNEDLLWEAVKHYRAGLRAGTHSTKTRGLVSGAGKKLWKQKGTGRARIASIRSPLWRHGGTVHGPKPRSYEYDFPRKKVLGALRSALAAKLSDGKLVVVENFDLKEAKSKTFRSALNKLNAKGTTLVVEKYIGETEKNLDRIFAEAERVNGVLLFDEADAIFGKRSEVRDARDRYANIEVAYLLQRMEQFEGVAILTTNLRANVDEAFLRRLDLLVEFPMPDGDSRQRLWKHQLRTNVPRSDDIDFAFLSAAFELSGGNIRNIVLAAAFQAADGERPIGMADLVQATAGEYRKLGRLCVAAEFGPYHDLVSVGSRA
jgi:50S ribosomal protein L4